MTTLTRQSDFDAAVARARAAAAAYYDTGELLMSDAEYDQLLSDIEQAVATHPDWDDAGLLTAVAAGMSAGGDVTHPQPMGSLDKAKDLEAIAKFVASVGGPVAVEPKLDGLAIRAAYTAGKLTLVATRGDGTTGEDVTARAIGISGLPRRLPQPLDVEIRGEVYMTDADFEVSNANRVAAGKPAFANSRNAVAGSLRVSEREYAVTMSFAAYDVLGVDLGDDHAAAMDTLASWGVRTAASLIDAPVLTTAEEVTVMLECIDAERGTWTFPTDGAVIKAAERDARERLGHGSRSPKWAVAYKFAPNEATSTLLDIEVAVGRTGRISLRGRIEPVPVGGTTISYATLHNPAFVTEQGLAIGQRVMVVRAGDVIPRITAAVGDQPDRLTPWTAPATCPQCDESWDTSSLLWRCLTPECSTVGRITYAVSRDCLDIDGASEAICTALVDAGLVSDIADLFTLTVDDLADLELGITATAKPRKLGRTVAAKLITQIDEARTRPLNRLLTSLGVRTLGRTLGRRIAAQFPTLAAVRAASAQDLAAVDGIGTEKAAIIAAGLADMSGVLDRLEALGVTGATSTEAAPASTPLAGKTVVVTGAMTGPLATLSRNQVHELIETAGGKASGTVSAKTHLLVCSDPGTSKARKAAELGIEVISPEQFAVLVGA